MLAMFVLNMSMYCVSNKSLKKLGKLEDAEDEDEGEDDF
jgi:hypothetical protein